MKYVNIFNCITIITAVLFTNTGYTQVSDSLTLFNEMKQVMATCRQKPLQMEVEISNNSNFALNAEDSVSYKSSFHLDSIAGYVRFGDIEQIVNDSLAAIVNNETKQIIVFSNVRPILDQMQRLGNWAGTDSTVEQLGRLYTATAAVPVIGLKQLLFNSRNIIQPFKRPSSEIKLLYDVSRTKPVEVKLIQRVLLPISEETYNQFKQQGNDTSMLLKNTTGYFLLREQTTMFFYRKIAHETLPLPVEVKDRIVYTNQSYQHASGYEQYTIVHQP